MQNTNNLRDALEAMTARLDGIICLIGGDHRILCGGAASGASLILVDYLDRVNAAGPDTPHLITLLAEVDLLADSLVDEPCSAGDLRVRLERLKDTLQDEVERLYQRMAA